MPELVIKISPDGSGVEIEGKTFMGPECEEVIRTLGKGVGEVVEEKHLPEFFQTQPQRVKV